jgi:hypothetical protein
MKRLIFIVLIEFLWCQFLDAQNRRSQTFYFTPNFVISIDNDTVKVDTLIKRNIFSNVHYIGTCAEGYSCIADTSGDLVYFTSAKDYRTSTGTTETIISPVFLFKVNKINNRYNPEIFSNPLNSTFSDTQGTIILPIDEKYFIFTVKYLEDIVLGRGIGGYLVKGDTVVEQIYNFNQKEFEEKLTAIRHCNGRDWWVLTKILNEDSLKILLLSTDGILCSFNSLIPDRLPRSGGQLDGGPIGKLLSSPKGNRIAFINYKMKNRESCFSICGFDRKKGRIDSLKYSCSQSLSLKDSIIALTQINPTRYLINFWTNEFDEFVFYSGFFDSKNNFYFDYISEYNKYHKLFKLHDSLNYERCSYFM